MKIKFYNSKFYKDAYRDFLKSQNCKTMKEFITHLRNEYVEHDGLTETEALAQANYVWHYNVIEPAYRSYVFNNKQV